MAMPGRAVYRKPDSRATWTPGWALVLATCLMLTALPATAADAPEITSQGFDISEAQSGLLGQFDRLRVRFEVPKRIESLIIKERSYEIDLATTPERSHFDLFGLESRVRLHQDVTLDFANYINQKLETADRYEFRISVTDRDGQSAMARLLVEVGAEKSAVLPPSPKARPVEQASFEFRRVGGRDISGAENFALGWKTVDSVKVMIAINQLDSAETKFLTLAEPDYEAIRTKGQLIEATKNAQRLDQLKLPAANNEAAGSIFVIEQQDELFVFMITESFTSLSELGTTVTLVGEYKH